MLRMNHFQSRVYPKCEIDRGKEVFDVSQDALLFAEIYRNRKLHNMISKLMNSVPVSLNLRT